MKIHVNLKTALILWSMIVAGHTQAALLIDGTFNNSDWTAVKVYDDTPGQSATFTASQSGSGGNLGAYRRTTHDWGFGNIIVAHVNTSLTYDPATQGAISSINYSFDLTIFDGGASGGVGYGLVLLQNGLYYIGGFHAPTANQWISFGLSGLGANNFGTFGSSSTPDFSSSGNPISFGYFTSNGNPFGTTHTESGIDNYSVSIVPVASVPDAGGTLTLLGLGCLAIGLFIRKSSSPQFA